MIELIHKFFASECFIRTYFHIYCPGCGGSRAAIALLEGDLIQSIKYNPLTLLFIVDVFLMTLLDVAKLISKGNIVFPKIRKYCNVTVLVFTALYFVLRNYFWLVHGIDWLGDFSGVIS